MNQDLFNLWTIRVQTICLIVLLTTFIFKDYPSIAVMEDKHVIDVASLIKSLPPKIQMDCNRMSKKSQKEYEISCDYKNLGDFRINIALDDTKFIAINRQEVKPVSIDFNDNLGLPGQVSASHIITINFKQNVELISYENTFTFNTDSTLVEMVKENTSGLLDENYIYELSSYSYTVRNEVSRLITSKYSH